MLRTCFLFAVTVHLLTTNGAAQTSVVELPNAPEPAAAQSLARIARIDWADFDNDGLDDAYVVQPDGSAQLMRNTGSGFEDVTLAAGVGLDPMPTAASWHDFDGDTRLDLLLFSPRGSVHLFQNTGAGFRELTVSAGLADLSGVERVSWHDIDGDGRADLHAVTQAGHRIFRNEVGDTFTLLALPPIRGSGTTSISLGPTAAGFGAGTETRVVVPEATDDSPEAGGPLVGARGGRTVVTTAPGSTLEQNIVITNPGPATPLPPVQNMLACTPALQDLSDPMNCLEASSVPMLNMLYPLSVELNVEDVSGDVGIGTTTPDAQLHIVQTGADSALKLESGGNAVTLDVVATASVQGSIGGLEISGPLIATGLQFIETVPLEGEALGPTTAAEIELQSDVIVVRSNGGIAHRRFSDDTLGLVLGSTVGASPNGVELYSASNRKLRMHADGNGVVLDWSSGVLTGGLEMKDNAGLQHSFEKAGNALFCRQDASSFGLGETSPSAKLHVRSDTAMEGLPLRVDRSVTTGTIAEFYEGATLRFSVDTDGDLFADGTAAIGTSTAAAQLEVESASGFTSPTLRVERLEGSGDIIEATSGADVEFRVDFDGDAFCDGSFTGGGADYAEWLPLRDATETLEPGDVVGVFAGSVSLATSGAQQNLVVSTNPVLVGNAASAETGTREGCERIAFLGQAPVKVRGRVSAGDFLLVSGRGDGTAVAIAPRDLRPSDLARLVGTAWEGSDAAEREVRLVNCAIGLDGESAVLQALLRVNAELASMRGVVTALADRVEALEISE